MKIRVKQKRLKQEFTIFWKMTWMLCSFHVMLQAEVRLTELKEKWLRWAKI